VRRDLVVRVDGRRVVGGIAIGLEVAARALHVRTAEVQAADARRREVDLLEAVLAAITDPQVAGRRVDRGAARIAQAVHPGLRREALALLARGEGIVLRDPVS